MDNETVVIKPYDMEWPEIISLLRSNHFYPREIIYKGKVIELQVNCLPILHEIRTKRLAEILGEGFSVECEYNKDFLSVKKKIE